MADSSWIIFCGQVEYDYLTYFFPNLSQYGDIKRPSNNLAVTVFNSKIKETHPRPMDFHYRTKVTKSDAKEKSTWPHESSPVVDAEEEALACGSTSWRQCMQVDFTALKPSSLGGFLKWGVPKMVGLLWKIPSRNG